MPATGGTIAVLVVGHEPLLRETYTMLFQRAGYTADAAELSHSVRRLKEINFAAVVMDHTLSKEERQSLVRLARQLSPKIKTVALHSSAQDCGADLWMDSRQGADVILDRVTELLERPGLPGS
jgi:DNA-binding response OmpR family regulator